MFNRHLSRATRPFRAPLIRVSLFGAIGVALFSAVSRTNATGMTAQPAPTDAARDAARLAREIVSPTGDVSRARSQLLILVEAHPDADLPETFAPALRDENTFTALLATYDDAAATTKDPPTRAFIRFNMLRLVLARAAFLSTPARRSLLARVTNLVETLAKDNKGDAAVWEATGDLYALKDDAANAAAAYRRMGALGPAPLAAYKTARAYQRVRDTSQARAAYEAGIKADAAQGAAKSSGLTRHLLYQGLASLYLADGRDKDAATALLFSARVKPDPDAPYALRFDVADALRKRGYAKEVRAYAQAVLLVTPDDETAKRLAGESGVGAVRR